jgi:hypothetical protein
LFLAQTLFGAQAVDVALDVEQRVNPALTLGAL